MFPYQASELGRSFVALGLRVGLCALRVGPCDGQVAASICITPPMGEYTQWVKI